MFGLNGDYLDTGLMGMKTPASHKSKDSDLRIKENPIPSTFFIFISGKFVLTSLNFVTKFLSF